jgi:hypothetical protein
MDEYQHFVMLFFLNVSFSDKATQDYSSILMLYCWPIIENIKIIDLVKFVLKCHFLPISCVYKANLANLASIVDYSRNSRLSDN